MVGEHDGDFEPPQEGDEGGRAEAVVAHLDAVAMIRSGRRSTCAGKKLEEGAEIRLVELLGRRELPEHRPELVAEFQKTLAEEAVDGFAGAHQLPPVGGEARTLQGEDEAVWRLGGRICTRSAGFCEP